MTKAVFSSKLLIISYLWVSWCITVRMWAFHASIGVHASPISYSRIPRSLESNADRSKCWRAESTLFSDSQSSHLTVCLCWHSFWYSLHLGSERAKARQWSATFEKMFWQLDLYSPFQLRYMSIHVWSKTLRTLSLCPSQCQPFKVDSE